MAISTEMKEELEVLKQVCIEDYCSYNFHESMKENYANNWTYSAGKKYIKIVKDSSVWGFIVNVETDPKFKYGDILKPASFSTPARNAARGNIFGDYKVQWTGPNYL